MADKICVNGCDRPYYAKGLCGACYHKARYHALTPEEKFTRNAAYRARRDKEAQKAYMANYYREHPEKFKYTQEQKRQWQKTRRERYRSDPEYRQHVIEQGRAWRTANPDIVRRINQTKRLKDPAKTKAQAAHAQWKRRALKKATAAVPYTQEQLKARLSMWSGCWLCGGEATEIDHVKPLSKGGAHMLANFRPICMSCNRKKRDLWPVPERLLIRR